MCSLVPGSESEGEKSSGHVVLPRKREPTEKKQFLLPGQGEAEEVYSHTNPPKGEAGVAGLTSPSLPVLQTSHIRNWIRAGALEELEMVVLEGQVGGGLHLLHHLSSPGPQAAVRECLGHQGPTVPQDCPGVYGGDTSTAWSSSACPCPHAPLPSKRSSPCTAPWPPAA